MFCYVKMFVNNNNVSVIKVVKVVLIWMKFLIIYSVNVMIKILIINFLVKVILFIVVNLFLV